jgi:hypothetical protein
MDQKFAIVSDEGIELDAKVLIEPTAFTMLSRGGTAGTPSSQNQDYSIALRLVLRRLKNSEREITGAWVDSSKVQSLPLEERQIFFPEDKGADAAALFSLFGKRMERVGKSPSSDPDKGNRNKRIRVETRTSSIGELSSVIGAKPSTEVPRSALRLPASDLRRVSDYDIWSAIEALRGGAPAEPFDDSLGYDLIAEDGTRLPPKAVFGLAASSALGFPVKPVNFTGGVGTVCFERLESAGWEIVSKDAAPGGHDAEGDDAERRWPEGDERRRSHLKRERHPGVARAKRAEQRRLHGRLFCEQCKMDPVEVFGSPDGEACIEVHHRGTEVANMQPGHMTRLADLECLCSNCHRVRHSKMRQAAIAAAASMPSAALSSYV